MQQASWEHFPHEADIGVRGIGADLSAAFAQTALALTALVTDLEQVHPDTPVPIHCEAPEPELLLVDWLNALIYEMATRAMLFSRFEVRIDGPTLAATAWGEPIDPSRHQPAVEPKGATYTQLRVAPLADGRIGAQCVIDV